MEAASPSRQRKPANTLRSYLGPEPEEARPRREFRHQLLLLALEAYRREEISLGKLRELGRLAQMPEAQMRELSQLPRHRAVSEFESRIWPITAGLPCEFGWGMMSGYQGCELGNQPGLSGSRGSREGRRTSELTTLELIAEKAKVLPPEKQQEVLDFLEFLHERQRRKGPLRSLRGLWKDLGPGISAEEIDEARREMWGKFPRDDV